MARCHSWTEHCVWAFTALLLRASVTALAKQQGFTAVSDDDFARVVIAQSFAYDPRWDASGSSWLPFPFWLTGTMMWLTSGTWEVAQSLAWVTSLGSVLLFLFSTWAVGLRGFWWGLSGCLFATLPHAVWLGAAVVPEGYTAVLALAGLCLATGKLRERLLSAGCLLAATLSRYETWPVAVVVAVFHASGLLRTQTQVRSRVWTNGILVGLCVAGPMSWLAHGAVNHGSALFFVKRVADYRTALGASPEVWWAVFSNYPRALLVEEPWLLGCAIAVVLWTMGSRRTVNPLATPNPTPRLLLVGALAQLAFLLWGDLNNGAPTHHPERAVLMCWLVGLVLVAHRGQTYLAVRRGTAVRLWGIRWFAVVAASAVMAAFGVWRQPSKQFVDRRQELTLGRQFRERLNDDRRLFVETAGYGYTAVSVGTEQPWLVDGYNPADPRNHRDGQDGAARLSEEQLRRRRVAYLALPAGRASTVAPWASPLGRSGPFEIFGTQWSVTPENSDPAPD